MPRDMNIRGTVARMINMAIERKAVQIAGNNVMKNKIIYVVCGVAALALTPGCVVEGPPPPEAVVTVYPDDYVWDGYEYVGLVGDQYYYLGPGNVWIVCDQARLAHFHDYVRVHPDWRAHVTVNMNFRGSAPRQGSPPSHGGPPPPHQQGPPPRHPAPASDHGRGQSYGHGNDRDNGHDNDHDFSH